MIITAAGLLLTSCGSLQSVSLEQMQAADISFPAQVRKVAVINNMPVVPAQGRRGDISPELEGDGKVAAEALAEQIANVNYFDQVVICDSAFRANDSVPRANVVFKPDEVKTLAADLGVDMIFSFDRVHIQTRPGTIFYADLMYPVDAIDAIISPVIRIYIPNRDEPLFLVAKQDSVSWEYTPFLSDTLIVREASEFAALIPMDHLLPHWREVTRYYYDGGNVEMRDAAVSLRENDWEGARKLWMQAYEKRKGKQKMRAAFNIALSYEVEDDVPTAKEWVEKALKLATPASDDHHIISLYSAALRDREAKLTQLKLQMKRFEE